MRRLGAIAHSLAFGSMRPAVRESHKNETARLTGRQSCSIIAYAVDEYLKWKPIVTLLRAEASDEEEHHRQIEGFRLGRGT
jgi:hypothetical protein